MGKLVKHLLNSRKCGVNPQFFQTAPSGSPLIAVAATTLLGSPVTLDEQPKRCPTLPVPWPPVRIGKNGISGVLLICIVNA